MSKKSAEDLLTKGGADKEFRAKYNAVSTKEKFVELATADGFDFTVEELTQLLQENGDAFESYGNPPKRSIWM